MHVRRPRAVDAHVPSSIGASTSCSRLTRRAGRLGSSVGRSDCQWRSRPGAGTSPRAPPAGWKAGGAHSCIVSREAAGPGWMRRVRHRMGFRHGRRSCPVRRAVVSASGRILGDCHRSSARRHASLLICARSGNALRNSSSPMFAWVLPGASHTDVLHGCSATRSEVGLRIVASRRWSADILASRRRAKSLGEQFSVAG